MGADWNEKWRLIRFRRRKERLRFSDEIRLVPKPLFAIMAVLLLVGELVAYLLCVKNFPEPWPIVMEYGDKAGAVLTLLIGFGIWLVLAPVVLLTGYVYRDAQRRGMNPMLWVFLVLLMLPAYLATGFVLYFVTREPLPYHCPKCGTMVSARFNYCPGCKYSLHPACSYCQREVGDMDKFCAHCGKDLEPHAALERV
jgi:hypothetical protein